MLYQTDLLSLKIKQTQSPKVHIVVSKKISPTAVSRNLLKRRLKASIGELIKKPIKDKTIFIYPKKTILNMINNVLEFSKPRYEDISLNKEALIEGIHVIDVKGSDIDVFIKEN